MHVAHIGNSRVLAFSAVIPRFVSSMTPNQDSMQPTAVSSSCIPKTIRSGNNSVDLSAEDEAAVASIAASLAISDPTSSAALVLPATGHVASLTTVLSSSLSTSLASVLRIVEQTNFHNIGNNRGSISTVSSTSSSEGARPLHLHSLSRVLAYGIEMNDNEHIASSNGNNFSQQSPLCVTCLCICRSTM